jgi:hypothetical protein
LKGKEKKYFKNDHQTFLESKPSPHQANHQLREDQAPYKLQLSSSKNQRRTWIPHPLHESTINEHESMLLWLCIPPLYAPPNPTELHPPEEQRSINPPPRRHEPPPTFVWPLKFPV